MRLRGIRDNSGFDFSMELGASEPYVRMNFAYWGRTGFADLGLPADAKMRLLGDIVRVWHDRHSDEYLLGEEEIVDQDIPRV